MEYPTDSELIALCMKCHYYNVNSTSVLLLKDSIYNLLKKCITLCSIIAQHHCRTIINVEDLNHCVHLIATNNSYRFGIAGFDQTICTDEEYTPESLESEGSISGSITSSSSSEGSEDDSGPSVNHPECIDMSDVSNIETTCYNNTDRVISIVSYRLILSRICKAGKVCVFIRNDAFEALLSLIEDQIVFNLEGSVSLLEICLDGVLLPFRMANEILILRDMNVVSRDQEQMVGNEMSCVKALQMEQYQQQGLLDILRRIVTPDRSADRTPTVEGLKLSTPISSTKKVRYKMDTQESEKEEFGIMQHYEVPHHTPEQQHSMKPEIYSSRGSLRYEMSGVGKEESESRQTYYTSEVQSSVDTSQSNRKSKRKVQQIDSSDTGTSDYTVKKKTVLKVRSDD